MPDAQRIARRLDALWGIARGPAGGAQRPAFSDAEAEAMLLAAEWAREHGLAPGIDEHGNLWALPEGFAGPVVTSGSHVDTVPDGGRYDGALGTVLGLEAVVDLPATPSLTARDGLPAESPLTARAGLLVCAAEEAPRFGAGTIGSRLLAGTLKASELRDLRDADGVSAAEARSGYLDALASLPRVDPPLPRWRAHAEVHVALRRDLRQLGVVDRVAAPRRLLVTVTGRSGHAGEVAMADRRDALAAASEIVLAVEAAARRQPVETVATVGTLEVAPAAVSVIPGAVRLGLDMRGIEAASLDALDDAIRRHVAEIAERRGVEADVELTRTGRPVRLDPGLARAALQAAAKMGIDARPTWSGAGHDAQHINALTPALLVFVPLHGGESHTPQEGADLSEIVAAGQVVAAVLGDVAR